MITPNTYEEVYEILSLMDKMTVMKIPEETLKIIKEKRNIKYVTKIEKNDIFNKNNISEETLNILCYFDYYYWIDNNKRKEMDKIYKLKIQKAEKEKSKVYSPEKLFNDKKYDNLILNKEGETLDLIEYREIKRYRKLFRKFLELFKK